MNVLIVSNALPYPPHDGSRLTLLNLLENFSSSNRIDLITLIDDAQSESDIEMVASLCSNLTTVVAKNRNKILNKVVCNLSADPYNIVWRYSKEMALSLRHKLKEIKYDVLTFYGVSSAQYGVTVHGIPKIAYELDAGSLYFRRNFQHETSLHRKLFYLSEHLKIMWYERRIYPDFDRCIVVSEIDKTALLRVCPSAKIDVIPNGTDADYFRPAHKEEFPLLLFSGNMDYPPNIHAALWFYRKVFPTVVKEFPEIRLCLAGRNPSEKFDFMRKDHRIIITGFVKDIRPWFDKASLYLCPMISGTGIKNKILEAMAMEKAIVATSLSLDGIPGSVDFVLNADTSEEFSKLIIKALRNSALRKSLGKMGREFVLKNYKWSSSAKRLENIYAEVKRSRNTKDYIIPE